VSDFLRKVAADRISGERPGPFRALAAAIAAGVAVAVLVYRLLRRESS
jgi:hypothetical protein